MTVTAVWGMVRVESIVKTVTPESYHHASYDFSFPTPFFGWTDGESKTTSKNDTSKGKGKGKKKKKRKSNDEALEDSDDGDYEGLEVDYMSDESRSDPLPCCTQIHYGHFSVFILVVVLLSLVCYFIFQKQFRRRARKGKTQQRRGPP